MLLLHLLICMLCLQAVPKLLAAALQQPNHVLLKRLFDASPSNFGQALAAADTAEPGMMPHICNAVQARLPGSVKWHLAPCTCDAAPAHLLNAAHTGWYCVCKCAGQCLTQPVSAHHLVSTAWQPLARVLCSAAASISHRCSSASSPCAEALTLHVRAQELDEATAILEECPFTFAIDLAAALASCSQLSLEAWLVESVHRHKQPFAQVHASSWLPCSMPQTPVAEPGLSCAALHQAMTAATVLTLPCPPAWHELAALQPGFSLSVTSFTDSTQHRPALASSGRCLQAVLDFTEALLASGFPAAEAGTAQQPLGLLAACLGLLAAEGVQYLPDVGAQVGLRLEGSASHRRHPGPSTSRGCMPVRTSSLPGTLPAAQRRCRCRCRCLLPGPLHKPVRTPLRTV